MRQFILCILLFSGTSFYLPAQDSTINPVHDTSITIYTSDDSLAKKKSMDQMSQNLNRFVKDMQERDKKAKRDAMLRIGIGVFFLAVLVLGIVRKRKKKA